tara:strand:+ start:3859 stop:4035 length:177 start_codon:yes stop_codon:yes gene_type:complete
MKRKASLGRIFAVPAALFVIGLTGLVWALLVDGPQDILAGLAVASSLGVLIWAIVRKR